MKLLHMTAIICLLSLNPEMSIYFLPRLSIVHKAPGIHSSLVPVKYQLTWDIIHFHCLYHLRQECLLKPSRSSGATPLFVVPLCFPKSTLFSRDLAHKTGNVAGLPLLANLLASITQTIPLAAAAMVTSVFTGHPTSLNPKM